MKSSINFVTFYPKCPNYGLFKDVGQIPNSIGMFSNDISTALVSCEINQKDENIKNFLGMSISKISYIFNNDFITGLFYLLKNSKKIDWLNLYHGGRKVYYWTKLYKFINPKGKVYLKLDLSFGGCKKIESNHQEIQIFNRTVQCADLVSVESEIIRREVKKFCSSNIICIPNGYIDTNNFTIKKLSLRKDEFITVARLGDESKATDLLLEGFRLSSSKHNWNLRLVGPVAPDFRLFIEKFFNKWPEMKNRIFFTGPVFDKTELYEYYNSAKVFVLPSRWEAFPLVGPEAAHCGCRMIFSDVIPPFNELTDFGKYGIQIKVNSISSICEALISEANRKQQEEDPYNIYNYAKNLSWKKICTDLVLLMKNSNYIE